MDFSCFFFWRRSDRPFEPSVVVFHNRTAYAFNANAFTTNTHTISNGLTRVTIQTYWISLTNRGPHWMNGSVKRTTSWVNQNHDNDYDDDDDGKGRFKCRPLTLEFFQRNIQLTTELLHLFFFLWNVLKFFYGFSFYRFVMHSSSHFTTKYFMLYLTQKDFVQVICDTVISLWSLHNFVHKTHFDISMLVTCACIFTFESERFLKYAASVLLVMYTDLECGWTKHISNAKYHWNKEIFLSNVFNFSLFPFSINLEIHLSCSY